jgi:hypothetical protein
MKKETFVQRLSSGKVNNLTYSSNGKEGLISVWMHEGAYVLTWEECPHGEQYDESTYTRDERHVFAEIAEILDFISSNGFNLELFTS